MKSLREIYYANISNPQLAELLKNEIVNGADLNDRNFYFGDMIGTIKETDFIQIYALLKERKYSLPDSMVHDFVHGGYFELLSILMGDNYDINVRDSAGENALFNLVKRYNEPVHFKTRLEKAIAMGADYRLENSEGENLLHAFASGGCPDEYLHVLLRLPLDVNKANARGWTPLHILCVNRIDEGAIEMLMDHGADPKLKTGSEQDQYLQEYLQNHEDISEGSYNAFELRMKYLSSLGGEYSEGSEAYEELTAKYKELFNENE